MNPSTHYIRDASSESQDPSSINHPSKCTIKTKQAHTITSNTGKVLHHIEDAAGCVRLHEGAENTQDKCLKEVRAEFAHH